MQSEPTPKKEEDAESPDSNIKVSNSKESLTTRPQSSGKASAAHSGTANGQFPPPKTDKPRPHVCNVCGRSFARLEHLKRHERSHTKEKPFECPECTRCFARRDLLLRHQQKLHMTGAPSRPRGSRRESVAGPTVANGRVRKNSIANGSLTQSSNNIIPTQRPRANTISHIDYSGMPMMDNPTFSRMNPLGITGQQMNMGGLPHFDYRGMSTAQGAHGSLGIPRLDTHTMNNMDISNSLRTAPPFASFGGFDLEQFAQSSTINPAQLHFGATTSAMQPTFSPLEPFTVRSAFDPHPQLENFSWMREWHPHDDHENAIDESSPSRMSSGDSPGDFTESMTNSTAAMPMQSNFQWPAQNDAQAQLVMPNEAFQLQALSSGLPMLDAPPATISPNTLHDPTPTAASYFQMAMLQQQQQQQQQHQQHQQQQQRNFHQHTGSQHSDMMASPQQQNFFTPSMSAFDSDSPSMSSSMTGSARHSSVTSMSTGSITDATRQALLMTLAQPSPYIHSPRTYSQPAISSPLSGGRRSSQQPHPDPVLPSTDDIRRFVESFIKHAHPHLPVTHIPTLSFDLDNAASPPNGLNPTSTSSGAGCLILTMAAIGALYEFEHPVSRELFMAGRKILGLYLEERRRADMTAAISKSSSASNTHHDTPLWLVQAMLLNVIYGHQCGERLAGDIASGHSATLVSLAYSAQLHIPTPLGTTPGSEDGGNDQHGVNDVDMIGPDDSASRHQSTETDLQTQWLLWKTAEERKRTMWAIHTVSSLLTTSYNAPPSISNTAIELDLPCDEALYHAETAQQWQQMGGLIASENSSIPFSDALASLLTAYKRPGRKTELQPSTFGCLVLINAIHNYIWETRNRHDGMPWTTAEITMMINKIEPALNAWQEAWKATEHHKVDRPNPVGMGPLSADSIPLLDLAFVRLFVNFGRSKVALWNRDFDLMAHELARGSEMVENAESSSNASQNAESGTDPSTAFDSPLTAPGNRRPSQALSSGQASSKRERHLRKAAFYAVDHMTVACSRNLTYVDTTAHELPVQSAMCFFDCSQVLAEWACTVQERVGRHLGVLGRDQIDFAQVPAIMLLGAEDIELFRKIDNVCTSLEVKRIQQENMLAMEMQTLDPTGLTALQNNLNTSRFGVGSRILRITASMLEKAIVWPVTHVLAKALETQADHMDQRAEASIASQ